MVVVAPQSAAAATIVLTAVDGNLYQQNEQNPCIFTNPSCQQGGWVGTALPTGGGVDSYDAFVSYTNSTLQAKLGTDVLMLGVDINQASGQPAQTLTLFEMLVNGVVVDTFSFAGDGNVSCREQRKRLCRLLTVELLAAEQFRCGCDHWIPFRLQQRQRRDRKRVHDPGEGQNTPVPEPATMLLLGTGLLVAARARRRKS